MFFKEGIKRMIEFLLDEKFLIPFLSTLGAALTIISMQFIARLIKDSKQKIYAINYMSHVSFCLINSEIILKRHTILPHIEATEKMAGGDGELMAKTFLSDEFDILTEPAMDFNHLPNDYSLQIGYDDINLVQMFNTLLYLHKCEHGRVSLNNFVKNNLKSSHDFNIQSPEKQKDILFTYHDHLTKLEHESDRLITFTLNIITPTLRNYLGSYKFLMFNTKCANDLLDNIIAISNENEDMIPPEDYMESTKNGGIQNEL